MCIFEKVCVKLCVAMSQNQNQHDGKIQILLGKT